MAPNVVFALRVLLLQPMGVLPMHLLHRNHLWLTLRIALMAICVGVQGTGLFWMRLSQYPLHFLRNFFVKFSTTFHFAHDFKETHLGKLSKKANLTKEVCECLMVKG